MRSRDALGNEIFVSCKTFTVEVRVAPADQLSSLEGLFLQAIHRGQTSFNALVDLFGIGPRPTLDLLFDLWRQSLVVLDLARAEIELAPAASQAIQDGRLDRLFTAEESPRPVQLMQEQLTGQILPAGGPTSPGSADRVVPFTRGVDDHRESPHGEILRALRESFERSREREKRPVRILGAHLKFVGGEAPQRGPARRWLALTVDLQVDEDSGLLTFRIVEPTSLNSQIRGQLERKLEDMADERPNQDFFKRLREKARGVERTRVADADAASRMLAAELESLDKVDVGTLVDRHEDFAASSRDALYELKEEVDTRVNTHMVVGTTEMRQRIDALIRLARHQIVMCCPQIDHDVFNRHYHDPIREALAGGRSVFLLWGRRPGESLDRRLWNAFVDLRSYGRGDLFVAERPVQTDASFVVCDGDQVLWTSFPFLQEEKSPFEELGIGLEATDRTTAVYRLLDWSRDFYTDWQHSRLILATAQDFAPSIHRREDEEADDSARSLPEPPTIPLPLQDPEALPTLGETSLDLWRMDWRRFSDELSSAVAAMGPNCQIVRDAQHRQFLWSAIRDSRRRLVIGDEWIDVEVINDRFCAGIERSLKANPELQVALCFAQERKPRQPAGGGAITLPKARLEALRDRHPDRIQLVVRRTRARFVVSDDSVLMSSFPLLASEGVYAAKTRRRLQYSVGLLLRRTGLARDICDHLSGSIGLRLAVEDSPAEPDSPPPPPDPIVRSTLVQELLNLLIRTDTDRPGAIESIREWFEQLGGMEDAWAALDDLGFVEAPDDLMERAVHAVLSMMPAGAEASPEFARWAGYLAAGAWRQGRSFEAALWSAGVPDEDRAVQDLPPAWLIQVAALWDRPALLSSVLYDVAIAEPENPGERRAHAAACIAAALVHGDPRAAELLRDIRSWLDEPLRSWVEAARVYWEEMLRPLAMDTLRAAQDRESALRRADEARLNLVTAVERVEQMRPDFALGYRVMWPYMFSARGTLGQILSSARQGDPTITQRWLEAITPDGEHEFDWNEALGAFLDEETDLATHGTQFAGVNVVANRRTNCVSRLQLVVRPARIWLREIPGDATISDPRFHAAMLDLLRALQPTWDSMERLVERLEAEQSHDSLLLRRMLDDMQPLRILGAS